VDRHLLPEEIDLLIDGEAGFGVAPLKAHVRRCPDCEAELETARLIAGELDLIPHFSPAPLFADRVMQQVQVFEPWHVAARDAVRQLVPQSAPARVFAAAGGLTFATLFSLAAVWVIARVDVLAMISGLALERSQESAQGALGAFARSLMGDGAPAVGAGVLALALAAFVITVVGATAGLRAVTASGRRRQG
jgi:hypothetical protein